MKKSTKWWLPLAVVLALLIINAVKVNHHRAQQKHDPQIAKEERTQLQKERAQHLIEQQYRAKGLTGEVHVQSLKKEYYGDLRGEYNVCYDYAENVAGKKIKFDEETTVYPDFKKFFDDKPFTSTAVVPDDFRSNLVSNVVAAFANKQPAVQQQYRFEKQQLAAQLPAAYHVESLQYSLSDDVKADSPQFASLRQTVLNNHQQGLPFAGYYDLDVQGLAREGTFVYRLSIECNGHVPQKLSAAEKKYLAVVRGLNFNGFWDGTYNIDFTFGSETVTVEAVVQNGQLQSANVN